MGTFFEAAMLLCFGLSWPINIAKSWKSRTARGKSLLFELLVFFGYALGTAGKFISGNVSYVVAVYILDLVMVAIDLILTFRNIMLDKIEDKRQEKALAELTKAAQKNKEEAEA